MMIFLQDKINNVKRIHEAGLFAFFIFMSIVSAPVMACLCSTKPNGLDVIYSDSKGIYLTAISGISNRGRYVGDKTINVDLTVLKVFKGDPLIKLEAVGYGKLPEVNKQGEIVESNTSCDMKYVFGSIYIVVEYMNKQTVLAQCSDSIIGLENWGALMILKERKFQRK